jgi:hypothetical protein
MTGAHKIEMGVDVSMPLAELRPHDEEDGSEGHAHVTIEEVSVDTHDHDDVLPGICIFLEGSRAAICLSMGPSEARQLAEAILANGVVSPGRN